MIAGPVAESSVAELLCSSVDWNHGSLADSDARGAWLKGRAEEAAILLVKYLRNRARPFLGFSPEMVGTVRASATPGLRREALEGWEAAFASELLIPYHSNCFAALGPEAVFLGEDPSLYRRMAEKILNERPRWQDGLFGVTHGICDLLRMLWPVPECDDACLVPILGWALTRYPKEWAWVRIWSERTLSPVGHNWWAHAVPGFWMLGVILPEIADCRRFLSLGSDYLERELRQLFEPDGWSKEGSPGYHEFAYSSLLAMADLASANDLPITPKVEDHLARIADSCWKMALPDCAYPLFGDWVRGNPYSGFVGQWRKDRQLGNLLRTRAARFNNGECKFVAEALDGNHCSSGRADLLFETSPLARSYSQLEIPASLPPDTALTASGYYIMRSGWTSAADCLAFTAASIGPAITSHKHADLLSFELYSRGRRILVDNGYGSPAVERDGDGQRMWRVATEAHNTCDVDGEDQSRVISEFRYADHVVPHVESWQSGDRFAYLSAVHDGYRRRKNPVAAVRRKIFWLRGEYWIVLDRFTTASTEPHDYRIHFHCAAPCAARNGSFDVVTSGPGGNLLIHPLAGLETRPVISPHPYPLEGYENPARITFEAKGKGDWVIATLLVPFEGDAVPAISTKNEDILCDGGLLNPWQATAFSIDYRGRRDLFFCHHMAWNLPWESGGANGIRRVYHSQCPELNEACL